MSSRFIVPYGDKCPLCGRAVYLERLVDEVGTTSYSIWCASRDCPNYSGDYHKTKKKTIREYQKWVRTICANAEQKSGD